MYTDISEFAKRTERAENNIFSKLLKLKILKLSVYVCDTKREKDFSKHYTWNILV